MDAGWRYRGVQSGLLHGCRVPVRAGTSATADVIVVGSDVVGISIGTRADILSFQHSGSGTTQVFVKSLEEII